MIKKTDILFFLSLVPAACSFGDLDLSGKSCDTQHTCPHGYICLSTPVSPENTEAKCYPEGDAQPCTPGDLACAQSGDWVQKCEPDGFSWSVEQACEKPSRCNPDILVCSDACESNTDCPSKYTCDLGTQLCRPMAACQVDCDGICVEHACIPRPQDDVTSASGSPDMNCFFQEITPPPETPRTCVLTGRVSIFPLRDESAPCEGLRVLLLDPGPDHSVLMESTATTGADQAVYYKFEQVPTNREYLIEIPAETDAEGNPVVTTINAIVGTRADKCVGGVITASISVMRKSLYDTYTTQTIEGLQAYRGLVIGRVLDCYESARLPLGNVTVGLGLPPVGPGRIYYFPDESYLVPDLNLKATSVKGYWAAVGVPAAENEVGFAARQSATDISMGSVPFFLLPGSAAIVNLPLPSSLLP